MIVQSLNSTNDNRDKFSLPKLINSYKENTLIKENNLS